AAQNGSVAGLLGRSGTRGPRAVFEGRFGLFSSHLQDQTVARELSRITQQLGLQWESRQSSFKPYPAAHVLHPYIDALLRLRRQHGIDPLSVPYIVSPLPTYIVPLTSHPPPQN